MFKAINFIKKKEIIEVKVRDEYHNVFFHGKANIKDKNQMNLLFTELKHKGIDLPFLLGNQ